MSEIRRELNEAVNRCYNSLERRIERSELSRSLTFDAPSPATHRTLVFPISTEEKDIREVISGAEFAYNGVKYVATVEDILTSAEGTIHVEVKMSASK